MASFMLKQVHAGDTSLLYRHATIPRFRAGRRAFWRRAPPHRSSSNSADDLPTIKVDVNVVNVLASCAISSGGLVANLEQKDFTVLEDGKPQPIKYFTRETDLPLTIGLLIDVSGSQRNLIEIERSAASHFSARCCGRRTKPF